MAFTSKAYWFRQGKGSGKNPGILMYDEKFEFIAHECSKDGLTWNYGCKYRLTPKVKCPAKAKLTSYEDRDLPKRVYAFSSENLLKELAEGRATSVDGTFKACTALRVQQFFWMGKVRGFWTLLVLGWLSDKSETSYKIRYISSS